MLTGVLQKAISEYNEGQYSQALTTLLVSDLPHDDNLINYYLGLCYIKLGDFSSGKEHLELSIDADDNLLRIFQTRMLLAYTSIQMEGYKEALWHLEKLIDSGYESARLYSLVGYTYYKKNSIDKAIDSYRKALSLDPDNMNALNSLGYILAESDRDLKEAESLCRKALGFSVDNPAYLDSLGYVCLKSNKVSASFSFFNRAIKLSPGNEVITEHMGDLKRLRSMK